MSTIFTAQIGRVLSTSGMGSAESSTPYPVAQNDRPFSVDAKGNIVSRETGRIVKKRGGKWGHER